MEQRVSDGRAKERRAARLKQNSAAYADRRQKAGWRRVAVWVPEDRVADLKAFVEQISSTSNPALDDLLAGMDPETFHDPVDFGAPVGKEAL